MHTRVLAPLEIEGFNNVTVLVEVSGKVTVPSELTVPIAGAIQYGDVTADGFAPVPGVAAEPGDDLTFALLHPDGVLARRRSRAVMGKNRRSMR